MSDSLSMVRRAVAAGSSVATEHFRNDISVESKHSQLDWVTAADEAAQARIIEVIEDLDPAAAIIGEEGEYQGTIPEDGRAWIIDPIDGTTNFVKGTSEWVVAIAIVDGSTPKAGAIVAPARNEEYFVGPATATLNGSRLSVSGTDSVDEVVIAPIGRYTTSRAKRERFARYVERIVTQAGDLRRFGCAQLTLCLVATGGLDAMICPFPMPPWDTVAGAYMVERAGGTVTDLQGRRWTADSDSIVATNGRVHQEVLTAFESVGVDR